MERTLSLFADDTANAAIAESIAGDDVQYTLITDPSELPHVFATLGSAAALAYDLEFSDLNPWKSFQLLWQLSDGSHHFVGVSALVTLDDIAPLLLAKPLIGHNLVAERKQTLVATRGRVRINRLIDTMFAYQVAKSGLLSAEWGGIGTSGLDDVAEQYTGFVMDKTTRKEFINHPFMHYIQTLSDDWRQDPAQFAKAQQMARVLFTRRQLIYAANDVRFEHEIWEKERAELVDKGLYGVAMREFAAIPVFADLETTGWIVDKQAWSEYLYKEEAQADGTVKRSGLTVQQEALIDKCAPVLLDGLNALERKNDYDLVIKGDLQRRKRGGSVARTRTDRARVEMYDKDGRQRFADDVQRRLFTMDHAEIAMTSRPQVQDAFTGLGINLEALDKQAISDILETKLSEKNRALLKSMLELAVITKLLGTYGNNLLKRVSEDGILWFDLNMLGASATGRCSSNNPNLQNIPSRGELGGKFRSFFICTPDTRLIIADYSSLEQRIAAHCSQDPRMMQIYFENLDIHCMSASGMFGFDYYEAEKAGGYDREIGEWADKKAAYDFVHKVWVKTSTEKLEQTVGDKTETKTIKRYTNALTGEELAGFKPSEKCYTIKYMRDEVAKTCSFASNYGGDAHTLARSLKGKTMEELEEIYKSYRRAYAKMFEFMDTYGKAAVWDGYTTNLAGRKRFYRPTTWEKKPPFRAYKPSKSMINGIRRQGLNHPIQSLAADIVKDAMQLVYDEFCRRGWWKVWGPNGQHFGAEVGACIICQVHDEIIVRADTELAEAAAEVVRDCMLKAEEFYLTTVPSGATCHVGTSWSDK